MPKLFYVGIKGIIIQEHRALLLKCNNGENGSSYWDFPGGRIEPGESITDALHRELSEELPTAENTEIRGLVGAYQLPRILPEERGLMLLLYQVQAHVPVVRFSDEHNGFRWVDSSELESICVEAHLSDAYRSALLQLLG